MNLNEIFSTKEREKILYYILDNPEIKITVKRLSKELKLSKGLISQYLRLLERNKIIMKDKKYRVNMQNPLTKGLKIISNLNKIDIEKFKRIDGLLGVGLYGSWAKGTNRKYSDVDIWVKVKKYPSDERVAETAANLRKSIGKVKILILHPTRIERLKKEDPIFYHSLVFGSIILLGERLEV